MRRRWNHRDRRARAVPVAPKRAAPVRRGLTDRRAIIRPTSPPLVTFLDGSIITVSLSQRTIIAKVGVAIGATTTRQPRNLLLIIITTWTVTIIIIRVTERPAERQILHRRRRRWRKEKSIKNGHNNTKRLFWPINCNPCMYVCMYIGMYRMSQIRWFYGLSPKLVKIERCSFRQAVLDYCEKKYEAVVPSTPAFVSELFCSFRKYVSLEFSSNFLY